MLPVRLMAGAFLVVGVGLAVLSLVGTPRWEGSGAAVFAACVLYALTAIYDRLPSGPPLARPSRVAVNATDLTSDGKILCPSCGRANTATATECRFCHAAFAQA